RDLRAIAPGDRVLVNNNRTVRLSDGVGDRAPVVRGETAQVEDFDGSPCLRRKSLGCLPGTVDGRAVGHERDVASRLRARGLADRNHEVRTRLDPLVVRLAGGAF